MERREELESRVQASEDEVAVARQHVETLGGDASRELDEVVARLAEQTTARETIVGEIAEELVELYEEPP